MELVEQRLNQHPDDLEAQGWHARLLAWSGRWSEAEQEYRRVMIKAPNDTDILIGLADVLAWQHKHDEAFVVLDSAYAVAQNPADVLLRRAKLLCEMGHSDRARAAYKEVLRFDLHNTEARIGLASLRPPRRHELRIGADVDTFTYTDSAQSQTLALSSRWSSHWATAFGTSIYQRFGQDAVKVNAALSYRFTKSDWLSLGGAIAHDNGVIPRSESFFEYGHGFRFHGGFVRGLEASYQQRWLWYEGARVLTLSLSQIYYLPKDWTWALTVTGAHTGFTSSLVDWVPSGSTRLGFPLFRQLSGTLSFGAGSENFGQVDQIGRFAARTYSGGLKYRLTENQDISGYCALQDRTQDRRQSSLGMNYGFRF